MAVSTGTLVPELPSPFWGHPSRRGTTTLEICSSGAPALDYWGGNFPAPEPLVGGGTGVVYRMRGYDGSLAKLVYWNHASVDGTGAGYGGPGPLTDIVVRKILGA